MADRAIGQLTGADRVGPTDLFVLEQSGTAKKLTGQVLENWLVSLADGHGGIQSIAKVGTSGLIDTYRIALADTTTFDFTVTNGKSIVSVTKAGTSGLTDTYRINYNDGTNTTFPVVNGKAISSVTRTKREGLVDTYTIAFNDGTSTAFTITNGEKGDKGDADHVYIKWASVANPSDADMSNVPDNYIGIYTGLAASAPTTASSYTWFRYKGEKGDTGSAAAITNKSVVYAKSNQGTAAPVSGWGENIPITDEGEYLWTRVTVQFNTGEPIISYSVSRTPRDGTGSGTVTAVNNVLPDAEGNVSITPDNIPVAEDYNLRQNLNELSENKVDKEGFVAASNPNLLDNPWFTVNQRNFTGSDTHQYGFDRWQGAYWTYTDPSGYLCMYLYSGKNYAIQVLEPKLKERLEGEIVTATVFTSNGIYHTGTAIYHVDPNWVSLIDKPGIILVQINNNGNIAITPRTNIAIRAIKLELGSVSTLANDHAPDYATELAKCQRYFVRLGFSDTTFNFCSMVGGNSGYANGFVALPVPMRVRNVQIAPTKANYQGIYLYNESGESLAVDGLTAIRQNNGLMFINAHNASLAVGRYYQLRLDNVQLDFIADL